MAEPPDDMPPEDVERLLQALQLDGDPPPDAGEGGDAPRLKLTHTDADGGVRMVAVGDKAHTQRSATAEAYVRCTPAIADAIAGDRLAKGNVFEVAKVAGILAAKRTDELIPLCHSLPLGGVDLNAELDGDDVRLTATARTTGPTGVEMEALTAVSVAALTVIDMCKAIEPGLRIDGVRLLEKTGGKRGHWRAP